MQGSEFAQLRAFVTVAEHGSVARAAKVLNLSASALSQAVRTLETRLGVRLLTRTTGSVALTEAGTTLLHRLRPALSEVTAAVADLTEYRARPAGTVRVHAWRLASTFFLQPIFVEFHAAYPDAVLDISVDDQSVDIAAGGFDVGIRLGEVLDKDMVALRLGDPIRQIAVAAPSYLAQYGRPQHPKELPAHRCIRWRWPGEPLPYNWEFFENGRWFEVAVHGPLIVDDCRMPIEAAVAGLGIAFWDEDQVRPLVASGHLVTLLEEWSAPYDGYFLYYPRQRTMSSTLRAFIEVVTAAAARRSTT